ncbi:MAG: ABC transporter substrate-binding protein, partial [Acidimicrobiia bacterium]
MNHRRRRAWACALLAAALAPPAAAASEPPTGPWLGDQRTMRIAGGRSLPPKAAPPAAGREDRAEAGGFAARPEHRQLDSEPLVPSRSSAQERPPAAQVVRIPFPRDDGTLTPYTFEVGYPLVTLVYDTLLWRDHDGVPRPWLARSVETGDEGRRITLRLAEGAEWHDGRPVTSADVAFTFDFVAARRHPRFTPALEAVERVDAPDPATAVISLRRPAAGFLDQPLADLPILPAHLWRDLSADRLAPEGLPVGSGPFRLAEHRPGQGYRFEANRSYFRG